MCLYLIDHDSVRLRLGVPELCGSWSELNFDVVLTVGSNSLKKTWFSESTSGSFQHSSNHRWTHTSYFTLGVVGYLKA
jgi:hypothetical protein